MNALNVIKKYSKEFKQISITSILNKQNGRYETNETKKVSFGALFFKKEKYVIDKGRGYIEADVKIYSFEKFIIDDKKGKNSDQIKFRNRVYEIVSCVERDELNETFYIGYGVRLDDRDE